MPSSCPCSFFVEDKVTLAIEGVRLSLFWRGPSTNLNVATGANFGRAHTRTESAKFVALARKGRQARSEGRATGSVEGVHELLRLAYARARVTARTQPFHRAFVCQRAAARQYLHPAEAV
jgi:hypothetical protein